MLARLHFRRHLRATLALYNWKPAAMEQFDGSPAAALASFLLWLVILPCSLFISWQLDHYYFAAHQVSLPQYLGLRAGQGVLAALLPFVPVWLMCSWEGVADRFPRLVTSQNWQQLIWVLAMMLFNLLTERSWFSYDQIIALGTSLFVLQLVYTWFFCWRALHCSPFYAAGIATMLFLVASTSGDVLNLYLFGTARPFVTFGLGQ